MRGLPESLHDILINSSKSGVWSTAFDILGNARYRVINNTAGCSLPRLIIFAKDAPPPLWGKAWVPLNSEWIVGGSIRLCVSRGTLVPAAPDSRKSGSITIGAQAIFGNHGVARQVGSVIANDSAFRGSDGIFRMNAAMPQTCGVAFSPVAQPQPGPPHGWKPPPNYGGWAAPSSSGTGGRSAQSCSSYGSYSDNSDTPCAQCNCSSFPHHTAAALRQSGAAAAANAAALPTDASADGSGSSCGQADLAAQASKLFDLALPNEDDGPFEENLAASDPLQATIRMMSNPCAATDLFAQALTSGAAAVPAPRASTNAAIAMPVVASNSPAAVQQNHSPVAAVMRATPSGSSLPSSSHHHNKRRKPPEGTQSSWPCTGAVRSGGGGSDVSVASSPKSDSSSSSWSTGAYLLARFKDFSSHLAEKRRSRKQRQAAVPEKRSASSETSTGLKLSIIEKLGNLLETGDENQLEHIEKYLIDLNIDGTARTVESSMAATNPAGSVSLPLAAQGGAGVSAAYPPTSVEVEQPSPDGMMGVANWLALSSSDVSNNSSNPLVGCPGIMPESTCSSV